MNCTTPIPELIPLNVRHRNICTAFIQTLNANITALFDIAKEALNRKISLLTIKLNIELRKKFVKCHVWSIAFMWLRHLETKKIGAEVFEEL